MTTRANQENADEIKWDSWYVKNVPFAKGQTRTVVDEYSTGLTWESDSCMTTYETPASFTYILRTGRNWKGPIGSAKITVDVSRVPEQYDIVPDPDAAVGKKHSISWTFSNFKPTRDVSIDLMPRYPLLNGQDIDQEYPGADYESIWTPFYRANGVTMTSTRFLELLGAVVEKREDGYCLITFRGHKLRLTAGSKISLEAAPRADLSTCGIAIPAASVVRAPVDGMDTASGRADCWSGWTILRARSTEFALFS